MNEKEKFVALFREAQVNFSRLFSMILIRAGLSLPQYALLNQLALLGKVPMTELSKRLRISKPAVTHLVDRLEESHYLKRAAHPEDRRIYLLEIQPKGKKIVRGVQSRVLKIILKALDRFTESDRKTIRQFYASLTSLIDQVLSGSKRINA